MPRSDTHTHTHVHEHHLVYTIMAAEPPGYVMEREAVHMALCAAGRLLCAHSAHSLTPVSAYGYPQYSQ